MNATQIESRLWYEISQNLRGNWPAVGPGEYVLFDNLSVAVSPDLKTVTVNVAKLQNTKTNPDGGTTSGAVFSGGFDVQYVGGGRYEVTGTGGLTGRQFTVDTSIPVGSKPAALSFGPVVERVLPLHPKPSTADKSYSQASYIDFQSGSVIGKQWKLEELARNEKIWNKANGVDAIADEVTKEQANSETVMLGKTPKNPQEYWPRLAGIVGGSVFILAKSGETFDSLQAGDVDANLQRMKEHNVSHDYATTADPYWFLTGDGAKGVVQILGRTDDGGGMKIRYKLVQGALATGDETKPGELKPISAEAVAAYRELQEILHSKQPREFADPDVAKEFGELLKTFGESLKGTQAEPLWSKAQQVTMDSRRAFARGDEAEKQRLDREEKQLEQELKTLMQQAGAPIYPDEDTSDPSKPQASKAVAAPAAIFGRQSERVLKSNMANRDGVVGYRFKDNDEVAVPDSLTGHFKDGKGSRFTPELKQWMRDNHADVLVCFSGETFDVLTMDMRDRFVAEALEWSDVPPEKAARVLALLEKTNAEPGFGMTIGRSLKSGASDVNVVHTRDGFTGYWQIRPFFESSRKGVVVFSKEILTQHADAMGHQQKPGFDPVVERIVNDDEVPNKDFWIDLDAGNLLTPPLPTSTGTNQDEKKFFQNWLASSGADAMGETADSYRGLMGWDMVAIPLSEGDWDLWPENVVSKLSAAKPGSPVALSGKTDLPATYAFKTREGGMGILQITGFNENPGGVRIRYKLVKTPPATR